jgi:hypothetical protein
MHDKSSAAVLPPMEALSLLTVFIAVFQLCDVSRLDREVAWLFAYCASVTVAASEQIDVPASHA